MSKQLTKPQKVMLLTDGIQLWMDSDRADGFMEQIRGMTFDDIAEYEGRQFTRSMFRGFFLPEDIDGMTKRKNGQWQCKGANWHDRGENCACATLAEKAIVKSKDDAIKACGKCKQGYIESDNFAGMRTCDCMVEWSREQNQL